MVDPVMLFPSQGYSGGSSFPGFEDLPTVNFAHLRSFSNSGASGLVNEAIQLADELGLSNPPGALPGLDDLFLRLRSIRPDWDWQEDPNTYALTIGPDLADIRQQGIYNRAILCLADRSPYTQGLETELSALGEISKEQYGNTALGAWITKDTGPVNDADGVSLLQAIPLNTEQRTAIERAFANPLTVISGPPGTGKSQVVTALLMNAAWLGDKVLFASKNNKAVDVVEERVNALGARPILLRLGRSEHREALANYLSALLGSTATPEDLESYQQHLNVHDHLLDKVESQQDDLERLVAVRNQTDHLEQATEDLRSALGPDAIQELMHITTDEVAETLQALKELSAATLEVNRDGLGILQKLLWPFTKNARHRRYSRSMQDFQRVSANLEARALVNSPSEDTFQVWPRFLPHAQRRLEAMLGIREYFDSLKELQACVPLEAVAKSHAKLIDEAADNSLSLWQYWLRVQPAGLAAEDRSTLGDYATVLHMLTSADRDNRRADRRLFKRYYELFSEVAHLLPCWAVTSLSARGRLPFEAGMFDLVVIDEASQCDIASALPLLLRAKRAVIIGDPQQLRHISALRTERDAQLLAAHGLDQDYLSWSYSSRSLFDLASSLSRSEDVVELRDHHRSHSEIIQFSNEHFYQGKLRIATDYARLKNLSGREPAVRWIDVQGHATRPSGGGAVNHQEATAVVGALRQMMDRGYDGTIGVVSPFRAQANRIRDLVSQERRLERLLASADCLIDTVHRFQGDERDVIFFSPVVSEGISDSSLQFLRSNGNLFNVAITRARSSLTVVGDKTAAASSSVDYLQRFALYVARLEENAIEVDDYVGRYLGPEYPEVSRPQRVSDWERRFYRALYAAGHRPIPQYSVDQNDLDFAVFAGAEHRLNIEVDGERYHRDWDGDLCRRDQIRNQRLIELGWDVMRFWVYEIRDDLDGCIARVNEWVIRHSVP